MATGHNKNLPLVTVVTANYNGGEFLEQAIQSVLQQSYSHWEHIIVDDGSSDDSVALINRYAQQDVRIKPVLLAQNAGVSHARNCGIEHMRGELLTFLDADDYWHPEKLARQVAMFQQHPNAGVVVVGAALVDENGKWLDNHKARPRKIKSGSVSLLDYLLGNLPVSINSMTQRQCIESVGPFDPRYVIGEDYELWMRIVRRYDYFYIDEPLHYYRLHSSNATRCKIKNRESKIQILEELLEKDPELKNSLGKKFQVIMQRKYNSLGKLYYKNDRLEEARQCFVRASHLPGSVLHRAKSRLWHWYLSKK